MQFLAKENMKTKKRFSLVGGGFIFLCAGILFAFNGISRVIEKLSNVPNPFDSRKEKTMITYQLLEDRAVKIRMLDLFGTPVKEFNFSQGEEGGRAGENIVHWDGTDSSGQKVSKGGYLCQVLVEGERPERGIRKIGVIH